MDIQVITTFIQTVGFPIACVCYLLYAQSKDREQHAIESKQWTDALTNNTIALTELTAFIKEHCNDK